MDEAIRIAHQGTTLESKSVLIQLYIQINRLDLAEKEYTAMASMDEDATITQLTSAWLGVAKGGDKLQEAFYTFQELNDKYSGPSVLNGQAVCQMQKGLFEEAEGLLREALEKVLCIAKSVAVIERCWLLG
jgi:coatomer subunit epsilon